MPPQKKKFGSQKFGQNGGRIRAKFGQKVEEQKLRNDRKNLGKFTPKKRGKLAVF